MKEVMILIQKGGKVKIFAEGPHGAGTEEFSSSGHIYPYPVV